MLAGVRRFLSDPASTLPVMTRSTATRPAEPRHRPALSPSRAADFQRCPLQYRLRAIDRIPELPSRAAVRGTVVHLALERLFDLPAERRVPDRAAELVGPAWSALVAEHPELAVAGGDPDFIDEAAALVRAYFRLEDPASFEPAERESSVAVELPDPASSYDTPLRGIVDRIDVLPDGRVRVIDYKTGRVPGPLREARALFQLKFYALVLLRTRGIVADELRLLYLADDVTLSYVPDRDELLRFERVLTALWRAIRSAGATGDFPPVASAACGWCAFQELCPEFGGTPPNYPGWPDVVDASGDV